MMKRVGCIWIPNWPLRRRRLARPELDGQAIVLHETQRGAARVVACSAEAAALGVRIGMPLAEAGALAGPSLRSAEPHDPTADREALIELAQWCQRFSPVVGLEHSTTPDSLLLDVTGVAHLFGGEAPLAQQIVRDFARRRLDVRLAVADTLAAAWAVAHFGVREAIVGGDSVAEGNANSCESATESPPTASFALGFRVQDSAPQSNLPVRHRTLPTDNRQLATDNCVIIPPGGTAAAMAPLPVTTLRLPEETVDALHQLGIRRVGQLEALPREALASRFGPALLRRLAQASGRAEETIEACTPEAELAAECSLEHPTTRRATIQRLLEQLVHELADTLLQHGRGVLRLQCVLTLEGKTDTPVRIAVGLFQATAAAKHLFELAWMQLERVSFPSPVVTVRVEAAATAPLEYRQREMFSDATTRRLSELAGLVDRLAGRLGRQAVLGVRLARDAQPELAYRYDPLVNASPRRGPRRAISGESLPPRPLRLIGRPVAVRVASVVPDGPPLWFELGDGRHRVVQSWGPERIETGWWRGRNVGRDYYQVETTTAERFWLFRRLRDGQWFIHGFF